MTSKREEVMNMTHILEKVIYEHEEEYGEITARNLLREHIESALLERFCIDEHCKHLDSIHGCYMKCQDVYGACCRCGRAREEGK